ncbi:MAG: sigma 54-interacting transcriptional regulator [Myxococcota bacterium]
MLPLDWLDATERAWLAGEDDEAERLLLDGRPDDDASGIALQTLMFARYAAHLDEEQMATQLAERVTDMPQTAPPLRLWGALLRVASGERGGDPTPAPPDRLCDLASEPWLQGRLAACGARAALVRGNPAHLKAWLELGTRCGDAPWVRMSLLTVEAEVARTEGRDADATRALEQAIGIASGEGWTRAGARLQLRFGTQLAPSVAASPMSWISHAAAVLRKVGTWRDRRMLRHALRTHGRRLADRALDEQAARPMADLDRALGSLRMDALLAVQRLSAMLNLADPAQERERDGRSVCQTLLVRIRTLSAGITAAEAELGELISEALVERDRTAIMARAVAELEHVGDPESYMNDGARITAKLLDAQHCWLVERVRGDSLVVLGSHPRNAPEPDPSWSSAVQEAAVAEPDTVGRLPRRRASLGPAMAVPVEARPFRGALLLDKGDPDRRFREDDRVLATLIGVQLAHGLARMRAREAERIAHTRLEATFESIRDGVVAVDAQGWVGSANVAAARMLRMTDTPLVGARLLDIEHLQPLWQVLSASPRTDSTVVRLPHGTVVVTSRPVEEGLVVTLVELGRAELMVRQVTAARPRYTFDDIIGSSEAMVEARRLARLAAEVDATLLITGESGTGKEMFAQAVHMGGARAHLPFVGINCAALPRDLLEAELFGYERGAFTGARQGGQPGKFEQVGEGTLLLDEIGDMPLDMQAKLLRVLQERVVARLGSAREKPVRARLISTTNRNLEDAVARSSFRLDLLFRLRVLHVHIPPLRNRREDIPELAMYFLVRTARELRKQARDIRPHVMARLEGHDWPGNVRELANVIEREVTLLPHDADSLDGLRGPLAGEWPVEEPPSVRAWATGPLPPAASPTTSAPTVHHPARATARPMADVERETYLQALDAHDGKVVAAAKAIGVSKSQFYAKLKKWREMGLVPPKKQ